MEFNRNFYKKDYYKYYNLRKKFLINNANIFFNQRCKTLHLLPNYAISKNKTYNKASELTNVQYGKLRLNNEINFLYRKKNYLYLQIYNQELKNMNIFGRYWHHIKSTMIERLSTVIQRKYKTLNKKINQLQTKQQNTITCKPENRYLFHFHEPIKNLSNTTFSHDEIQTIQENYISNNFTPKLNQILDNLIVETEYVIQNNKNTEQNHLRYQIKSEIKKHMVTTKDTLSNNKHGNNINFKKIIKKIKDNDLIINKADKGNVLTIENKPELNNKTTNFLNNPQFIPLKSDPTNRFQNKIKELCKKSNLIINKSDLNLLINPNPQAPILRTATKIHKANNPIRPIVNYIPAPAYKLKKFLKKLLKSKLFIENKYNIINSKQLTDLLSKLTINKNSKMISLDIKDMYTNIPVNETLKIIQDQLKLSNCNDEESTQIISLLQNSLQQNYFTFNGNFYLQPDGLPMGSPLSSILSEIFLQHIEHTYIEDIKKQFNIIFYGRYVDDILILYNNSHDNSNDILNKFNNLHPSIKFTCEQEHHNKLNYLDLTIQKHSTFLEYNIFRKPTTSKLSIDNNSNHPNEYKFANFRFLLNRLNQIPISKNNYRTEFNNILQIATYNNFPINKIYQLNKKIKNKIQQKQMTTLKNLKDKPNQYQKITYYGKISDSIKAIFRKQNINIAFAIQNKNKKLLTNRYHETKKENGSGIYKLNCDCGSSYIGKTFRQFKKRLYEHRHSYLYNLPDKSNYAAHLLHPSHQVIPFNNNFEILKIIYNRRTIDIWEQIEIYKHSLRTTLINEQLPNYSNPLFSLFRIFQDLYT